VRSAPPGVVEMLKVMALTKKSGKLPIEITTAAHFPSMKGQS
jgi:hypothetical protein